MTSTSPYNSVDLEVYKPKTVYASIYKPSEKSPGPKPSSLSPLSYKVDEAFDKTEQLYSIPSQLGVHNALKLSVIVHFITACLIVGIGLYSNFHPMYWIGASIFNILLVYQHLIVKPNDLSRINLAFGTTNGVASIVFAFFTILSMYLTT